MDPFAVPAQDVTRGQTLDKVPRGHDPEERVHREALVARPVVARRPERIRAGEDLRLGPPERDLAPAAAVAHDPELERCARHRHPRHDVVQYAETIRERGAVALVPVEELDHPRGLAEPAHPLLDAVGVQGIEEPDAAAGDECVRTALHELVADPAKPELALVAEADGTHAAEAVVKTSPLASTTPSSQRASTRPPWNC